MTIDMNRDGLGSRRSLLKTAEANAETDCEIEFCASIRENVRANGDRTMLTAAQDHKLRCIAQAGGFWERDECSI